MDRTTVGRWESGKVAPQPPQRRALAAALEVGPQELDTLLAPSQAAGKEASGRQSTAPSSVGDPT
ncbi:helix-turn-helix transcriptional regulator [Streptomyces sp. NBC_01335]|uniref:helix-turn-helix transcriptional regulator n=1 Tax=Streptomyces sp. NBC_01335 TaxID=2903828 RepID=UPI002E13C169